MDDLLDQRLEIETPERVLLVHDLAGIGSRFTAGLVDALILCVPCTVALCGVLAWTPVAKASTEEEWQVLGMAATGVCYAIVWLYYLVFESLWGGRTPGKHLLRLRVMSVHGGPAPVSAVLLRNVLRLVDALPALFIPFVGGLSMFLTSRSQRVGDLVAGTVVVRERVEALRVPRARDDGDHGEELSGADIEEVDRFLARRRELLPAPRRRIAGALVERLRGAYGLPPGDAEVILGLLGARRTPREIRDLAGPAAAPREVPS